jgi:hypothetical protein
MMDISAIKSICKHDPSLTQDEREKLDSLLNDDKFFDKLKGNVRGFGYWCWKPQIIKQVLDHLDDGDILQYTDVGCRLNIQGKTRLMEYFELASQDPLGILAFQNIAPSGPLIHDGRQLLGLIDSHWTKGDLIDYFAVRDRPEITETPTIGAGIFFLKKGADSCALISDWLKVYETQFALADDSPSKSPNLGGFIENRHDQGIFSLLCKTRGVYTISAYEYWYPKINDLRHADWASLANMPIHAKRDKDYGLIINGLEFIKAKLHGLRRRLGL